MAMQPGIFFSQATCTFMSLSWGECVRKRSISCMQVQGRIKVGACTDQPTTCMYTKSHILKSVQPVCSLASITGTTVLPHVIDHANPVETFSKLSKSFIPAKMPTTYISMTPLKDYCFLVFSNNLDTNTQLDTH